MNQELGLTDVLFWVDSAAGNDANPGTQAQPFQTLPHALAAGPATPRGKYRIQLIGAGPYNLPVSAFGVEPVGSLGQPLMILGDTQTQVFTGTVSAVSGATVTVLGGGLVVDAYRGLTYHGLTGTSAGKFFTIATNDATTLTSIANTFGAAINDTFEILTPTTSITSVSGSLLINGPGLVGFYACNLTGSALNIAEASHAMFDSCRIMTTNLTSRTEANAYYGKPSTFSGFSMITDVGTQSGTVGVFIGGSASSAGLRAFSRSYQFGYVVTTKGIAMSEKSSMFLLGLDSDLTGAGANAVNVALSSASQLLNSTGWYRIVGSGAAGVDGLQLLGHSEAFITGPIVFTNCTVTAILCRQQSQLSINNASGSTGNGWGAQIQDSSYVDTSGTANTVSGSSGIVQIDNGTSLTWAQAAALGATSAIGFSSQGPNVVTVTARKTTASHGAIVVVDRYVPVDSAGGAFTQNLPAASAVPPGWRVQIKDETGNCTLNNVTVSRVGADTFESGATTFVINLNFGSVTVQSDGVSKWYIVARVLV